MINKQMDTVKNVAISVRKSLENKYDDKVLMGRCIEASELISKKLSSLNIKCYIKEGWCLYDTCDGICGEPCAPHMYILANIDHKLYYVDVTATQFEPWLEDTISNIEIRNKIPYWLKDNKPSIEEMEYYAGY